jgi:CRP/FNR family cyclic AMP-dependent transcriptional regulator
LRLG